MNDTSGDERLQLGIRLTEQVLAPIKQAFVGKDEIIDLLGISLVARENLFILGPPGTAKKRRLLPGLKHPGSTRSV